MRFSYQDSAIRTWLTDTSREAKRQAAGVMATLPDVIAGYRLSDDASGYRFDSVNWKAMSPSERRWVGAPRRTDREHDGGAQEPVQRIPIVFAGIGPRDSWEPMKSVDILPTILREMRLPLDAGLDGRARRLP